MNQTNQSQDQNKNQNARPGTGRETGQESKSWESKAQPTASEEDDEDETSSQSLVDNEESDDTDRVESELGGKETTLNTSGVQEGEKPPVEKEQFNQSRRSA